MNMPTQLQAYAAAQALVDALDRRDTDTLQQGFCISDAVLEEVYQALDDSFDPGARLSLAPVALAFAERGGQRRFIDFYQQNDQAVALDCVLFADGQPSETAVYLALHQVDGQWLAHYKYIGH